MGTGEKAELRDFSSESAQPTIMPGLMFNRIIDYNQFEDDLPSPKNRNGELQFNRMDDSYESPHFSIRSSDADMVYVEQPDQDFYTFQMSNDVSQTDSFEAEPAPFDYIQAAPIDKKKQTARAKLNKVSSQKTLRTRPTRKCADKNSENGASD